jgi:hypothetical protein
VRVKRDTSGRAAIAAMPSALSCVGVERVIAPTINKAIGLRGGGGTEIVKLLFAAEG